MNKQTPARPPENSSSFPDNRDADTQRVLARLTANPFLDPSMTIDQMRAAFEAFYAAMYADFDQIVDIENRAIAGRHGQIPIRIYTHARICDDRCRCSCSFMAVVPSWEASTLLTPSVSNFAHRLDAW